MARTLDLRPGALHSGRRQHGAMETRGSRFAQLDSTRIAAEAGAIAINAAALLLLLAPLNPHFTPTTTKRDDIVIIPVQPEKPPEMIHETEVRKPRITPVIPTITPQKIEVHPMPILEPLPGDLPVDPEQVAKVDLAIGNAITEPLVGAHLEYEIAPPPPYPVDAIRNSLSGTVMLRVLVDVDGKPIDVRIERSSGHRVLDVAARKHVLAKWRFRPAMQDGRTVQAIGLIPVDFHLDR